jgi:hypothetical protein
VLGREAEEHTLSLQFTKKLYVVDLRSRGRRVSGMRFRGGFLIEDSLYKCAAANVAIGTTESTL